MKKLITAVLITTLFVGGFAVVSHQAQKTNQLADPGGGGRIYG
jgi:hypothetical protein